MYLVEEPDLLRKPSFTPLAQVPSRGDRWYRSAEWHECLLVLLARKPIEWPGQAAGRQQWATAEQISRSAVNRNRLALVTVRHRQVADRGPAADRIVAESGKPSHILVVRSGTGAQARA